MISARFRRKYRIRFETGFPAVRRVFPGISVPGTRRTAKKLTFQGRGGFVRDNSDRTHAELGHCCTNKRKPTLCGKNALNPVFRPFGSSRHITVRRTQLLSVWNFYVTDVIDVKRQPCTYDNRALHVTEIARIYSITIGRRYVDKESFNSVDWTHASCP